MSKRLRLAAFLLAGLASLLVLPGTAGAATGHSHQGAGPKAHRGAGPKVKHRKNYKKSWTFKDKSQHRCVTYTVAGAVKYDTQQFTPSGDIEWTDQRLSPQPTLRAIVHAYSKGSCTGPAVLYKMTVAQHWSGFSCGFDPAIGFSIPWGVSVSFWPSCGTKSQASFHSNFGANSSYVQYTNGVPPITFGAWADIPPTSGPCYGVYVSATTYISDNNSNSYRSSPFQICLPWH
jgi:hypothetical protein